jgi:hypothetical protein
MQKQNPPHKLGANRHDPARKSKKRDSNFAQSRDIREDRGERQIKNVNRQTIQRG